jgi:6-phosphogluconolactonase
MPLTPATVTAGVRPGAITVDPSGRYVYVRSGNGTSGGTTIWQFNISASGALTPMSTPSVSSFNSNGSMVIDPAGAYLYSSRGLDLLSYPINADGSLSTPIVQTVLTAGGLRGLTFDRAGEHAYIGGEDAGGDGVVYQFSVASDGSLTAMTPASIETGLPFLYAPFAEPFDRFMYTVDNGFSRIVQFQRNENATLARLNHEPTYSATAFPWDMQVEPFGRFAYVVAPASISTFDIGETGLLTPAVPASVRAIVPESFTAFTLDFAGENVYVTGSDVNNDIYLVHQYRIGADGALTKIVSGSVATDIGPTAIAVAP